MAVSNFLSCNRFNSIGHMIKIPTVLFFTLILIIILLMGLASYLVRKIDQQRAINSLQAESLHELSTKVDVLKLENFEAKLNPHLFKNILNSIQSNAYQTYYAIDKLAGVLDYILYESKANFVTVKEEIEFTINYIEINKVKISPLFDLQVKTKVAEESPYYQDKVIAPLISVDLIENAFKHSDFNHPNSFIKIVTELTDSHFKLEVINKISPKNSLRKEMGGHGSETLDHRLKMIYGNSYSLIRKAEEDVFMAYLKINLNEFKTKMHPTR